MSVTLLYVLGGIATIVLPAVWGYAYKQIKSIKNEILREALFELAQSVEESVAAANNTLVKEARTAKEGGKGKLTKEQGERIKAAVVNTAKMNLSKTTSKLLEKELTSEGFENKINILIEKAVAEAKS